MTTQIEQPTFVDDPPHSRDLQEAVLACSFHSAAALEDVLERVDERLLYGEDAQALLDVIRSMHAAGVPVDLAGVRERVQALPAPRRGAVEMALLRVVDAGRTVTPNAVASHAERLRQYAVARALHQVGRDALAAARDPERAAEAASSLAQQILDATTAREGRALRPIGGLARDVWAELEQRDDPHAPQGREIRTGLADLDQRIGPMQGLVILGARPGMGKTSLALQVGLHVARNAAETGIPVLFESLEMGSLEIAGRALANLARVDTRVFSDRSRRLTGDEAERVLEAVTMLDGVPLVLQAASTGLPDLRRDMLAVKARFGAVPMVILDHAQRLMELLTVSRHQNRATQCALVGAQLAALAHDFETVLLCLVHLSRRSEQEHRAPEMSDLRDSGGWEMEADRVMFLHDGPDEDGKPPATGTLQVRVPKNRFGAKGRVRVAWMPQWTLFGDLDERHGADTVKPEREDWWNR